MPLISATIPNLINGVSQQPAPTRIRTACEEAVNSYMSVVSGLQKRQNSKFLSALAATASTNVATHLVKRDASDKYLLVASPSGIEAFDVETGATLPISGSAAYVNSANPREDLKFVTVADTTFVLNTGVTVVANNVAEDGSRLNPYTRLSVFIKRAVASTTYAVYVNNVLAAETSTEDNTTAGTALEGTAEIAEEMKTDAIGRGYSDAEVVGSVLTFTIPADADVRVLDQFGGAAMRIVQDSIQDFSDLPPQDKKGRLVKVVGDAEAEGDDYWVEFNGKVWVETFGWESQRRYDASTMPHKLLKTGSSFVLSEAEYGDRIVGDDESNFDPTFVGRTINALFLYKGRMGYLSDENLIMSEVSEFGNFYRSTVTQVIDSDRIDVASTTGNVNILRHAIAFGNNLVLFSDKQQFKVTQGDILSPATVGLQPMTAFDGSTNVPPVNSGPNVFFAVDGPRFSIVREMYIDDDSDQFDAAEITIQVPKYIPTGVKQLAVSTYEDALVMLAGEQLNELYIYKWFLDGKSKVQSAWSKWVFDASVEIVSLKFLDQDLIMVYKQGTQMLIDRVRLEEAVAVGGENQLLLDHLLTDAELTKSFDGTDTTITLPYSHAGTLEFWTSAAPFGEKVMANKVDGSTYTIAGDYTSIEMQAGMGFTFDFQFSDQFVRADAGGGEVAVQDGRLQLRYMSVVYQNSSFFEAQVQPKNRDARRYVFNARTFADQTNVLDDVPLETGEFRFPIAAQNTKVTIKLTSDRPFPCAFGLAEWDGLYHPRTQRI